MFKHVFLFTFLLTIVFSCKRQEHNVVATINGEKVFMESVDSAIHEKLYERLYDIYYSRKIALEYLVSQNLLKQEAVSRNISIDSLLAMEVTSKVTPSSIDAFAVENELATGIPDPAHAGRVIDIQSEHGKQLLHDAVWRQFERNLVAVLKTKYETKILLQPPFTPKIDVSAMVMYPISSSTDKIPFVIISDFGCTACQDGYPIFKKLIRQYGDRVSFYFAPYAQKTSPELLYYACAAETGNATTPAAAFDLLFEQSRDSINLIMTSKKLGIDHVALAKRLNDERDVLNRKFETSFQAMRSHDLHRTPSFIIDNRVYFGQRNAEAIGNYLDRILEVH